MRRISQILVHLPTCTVWKEPHERLSQRSDEGGLGVWGVWGIWGASSGASPFIPFMVMVCKPTKSSSNVGILIW